MNPVGYVINWIVDQLASQDVFDLYFVKSDLIDIPISEAEACETAHYDAFATATINESAGKENRTPLGKLVL